MTDRLPWYHDEDHEHELTASSVTHSPAAHHKEALGDDGGGDDHGDDHVDDNSCTCINGTALRPSTFPHSDSNHDLLLSL